MEPVYAKNNIKYCTLLPHQINTPTKSESNRSPNTAGVSCAKTYRQASQHKRNRVACIVKPIQWTTMNVYFNNECLLLSKVQYSLSVKCPLRVCAMIRSYYVLLQHKINMSKDSVTTSTSCLIGLSVHT